MTRVVLLTVLLVPVALAVAYGAWLLRRHWNDPEWWKLPGK